MYKRFLVLALGIAGLTVAASAAFASGDGETDGGLLVVASIKPVHSLVSAVMAGVAEPHLIIRGAQSPHTFSMRPSDAAALSKARVIFLIDEHKEVALAGPIGNLGDDALVVRLAGSQGLHLLPLREGGAFEEHDHDDDGDDGDDDDHREDDGHEHGGHPEHGDVDFHIWLDPENAVLMTYEIIEALSFADPDNAATYEINGYALIDRLDELIAEVDAELAPIRDKPFIVLHDAYRYFEQRFDLNAAGSISVNPERAPGAQRIAEIRDKVGELGGVCVFAEPQFDSRVIDVVTEGTTAGSGTVDPLGAGIEDGPELYFTLLRDLAASFKECMLGIG
ncbi:MAG: zinc ABC transporter substrate-binding protein [Spirochaetaceae bacterium]|nr:zinc ABC transporter substrate-binding protein [Spirochaetaceae bacterium]